MIEDVSAGVRMACDGRANGSIIGRNTFIAALLRAMEYRHFNKTPGTRRGCQRTLLDMKFSNQHGHPGEE